MVLIFLFADISVGVSGQLVNSDDSEIITELENIPAILIEGLPPLLCDYNGESRPCDTPLRLPDRGEKAAAEDYGWWLEYSPDRDNNGMDDRLQRIISGEKESVSTTAIIGEDGRKTVAIFVNYAWAPTSDDISSLKEVLKRHGWKEPSGLEGDAWFSQLTSVDTMIVDHVPVSALFEIWGLEGVVVVEMQDVYKPFLDVSVPATKTRASDIYPQAAHGEGGTYGSGVVVAVLDTGVDNEHTSLNDFDDLNDEPNENALSYDDHKWVAGYDATSFNANPDGSDDPNDGSESGHGTHAAGTAIGTGGQQGVHVGVAPGSYLVDIKVLTDTGGTNNQASSLGIQWMINNVDTDWDHNTSGGRGIQVASMSFGSFNAIDSDDPGDDGTSTN
ncbi:MAG: S8 family serine peptidase, partial [Candidatus Thermoplasmatota archaeon]|nr:S8 family serine peptidase [Candidatus Thermoplasmatota archaeon]